MLLLALKCSRQAHAMDDGGERHMRDAGREIDVQRYSFSLSPLQVIRRDRGKEIGYDNSTER